MTKRYYTWACNPYCLYHGGVPICYKVHGIILTNEKATKLVEQVFTDLKIVSYLYRDTITAYQEPIKLAIKRFINCAKEANWLDDIYLGMINSLNCKFEDKYLDHCKKLGPDQFREVSMKHISRRRYPALVTFDGLWYR